MHIHEGYAYLNHLVNRTRPPSAPVAVEADRDRVPFLFRSLERRGCSLARPGRDMPLSKRNNFRGEQSGNEGTTTRENEH